MYVCMHACMYVCMSPGMPIRKQVIFYSLACSLLGDPKRYVLEFLRPLQEQGTLISQRAHFVVHEIDFQNGNAVLKLNFSFTFIEMHHHVHCILA